MKLAKPLIICASMFVAVSLFAAQTFTGNDYLKLGKRQRVAVVKNAEADLAKAGVTVKKDPIFYCRSLDAFYAKNPNMKKEDFAKVLKMLIIMEYDWEQKGVDKDALAKQWLGEDVYKANKARAGSK